VERRVSERYAPLPYRALTLAGGDPHAIALVVHLYAQAHMTRWGWLRLSVGDLVRVTGATKHRVVTLLEALVVEGLAEREIVSHGGRLEGTRLRLFDPSAASDTDSDTDRTRTRRAGADRSAGVGHGPDTAADTTSRRPEENDQKTDVSDSDARVRAPEPSRPQVDPSHVAELLALQEADEPTHGMNQPRDRTALERALGRGVTFERLAALWAWSAVSEDPLVGGCRAGGWRRWSGLLKPPNGDARLDAAAAWSAAGRPTPQPRASGPPPRAAPRAPPSSSARSILDALADLEATGFALPGDHR
jgi:hypothetical protein